MKVLFILTATFVSFSASAFECKYGPQNKVFTISKTGTYLDRVAGYAYHVNYRSLDQYLLLSIEGGPNKISVLHESFGKVSGSYLELGHQGDGPGDLYISCD